MKQIFSALGGSFTLTFDEFKEKLSDIKAFLFDWDGVFNSGIKVANQGSPFAEPDAMGTNLLRLGYWLHYGERFPVVGIITGANNPTAVYLAGREHFQRVYMGIKDKPKALSHLCEHFQIKPSQVAYVFDDVNDLEMAKKVGLRFMVRRDASRLLEKYVMENNGCDYLTAHSGGNYAVREICELILGSLGVYKQVIEHRMKFDKKYQRYLRERNKPLSEHFHLVHGEMVKIKTISK